MTFYITGLGKGNAVEYKPEYQLLLLKQADHVWTARI